jgi:hypothetical protein
LYNNHAVDVNTNVEFVKILRFRIRDFTRRIEIKYRKNDRDLKDKN